MRPVSKDDLSNHLALIGTDPRQFLQIANEYVRQHPTDSDGYFTRHHASDALGRKDLAVQDLDAGLQLEPHWTAYDDRRRILKDLGRYAEAITAFNQAESAEPEAWPTSFSLVRRAECQARLGNLGAALADCDRLPEDDWTPGQLGLIPGTKSEVIRCIQKLATQT
jgi:tetratricopeptide (TPR) repeat protein